MQYKICEVRDDCHYYQEGLCQASEIHQAYSVCSYGFDLLEKKGKEKKEKNEKSI